MKKKMGRKHIKFRHFARNNPFNNFEYRTIHWHSRENTGKLLIKCYFNLKKQMLYLAGPEVESEYLETKFQLLYNRLSNAYVKILCTVF